MPKLAVVIAALILVLHGAIHLMGTAVYLKLGQIQGLAYKTTVLDGRVDLGESGIRVFGVLWMVAAIAFGVAALALVLGWETWRPILLAATLVSLLVAALDWEVAFTGAIVDLGILIVAWVVPRMAPA
jgi:hypothetical protein